MTDNGTGIDYISMEFEWNLRMERKRLIITMYQIFLRNYEIL